MPYIYKSLACYMDYSHSSLKVRVMAINKINTFLSILIISLIFLIGCAIPVNTTLESAQMLDKGHIGIHGSYSRNYGMNFNSGRDAPFSVYNKNYGFGLEYAFSDNYNMRLKYARLDCDLSLADFGFTGFIGDWEIPNLNFIELSNKFCLVKDKMAIAVPLSFYFHEEGLQSDVTIEPKFLWTIRKNDKFEFSVIPKVKLMISNDGVLFLPGINVGMGLSTDLNKYAIRPELGIDAGLFFTFAIGCNYYFATKKED